jgi:MFS family permease
LNQPVQTPSRPQTSNYRWVICGLLFFATTFNYMDRQVISYLKEYFCRSAALGGFGWSNSDFANLTSAFTAFYAIVTIFAGLVIDKIGTKIGLAVALSLWSVFGILNAFVGQLVLAHIAIRSAFGIGEAGNFPASIKTVAEWFPKRERALATAIFNSGSNFGAMVAALFVPWCMVHFGDIKGWKMAFILTGASGFVWLIFWFWLYNPPAKERRLSQAEYDYIHSDRDENPTIVPGTAPAEEKISKGSFGNMLSFCGRAPNAALWGTTLLIVIVTTFLCLMSTFFVTKTTVLGMPLISFLRCVLFGIAVVLTLPLQAKRWHDLGKSGWYVLLNLVPMGGMLATICLSHPVDWEFYLIPAVWTLLFIVLLGLVKGDAVPNKYGPEGRPGILGYFQAWAFLFGKFMTDGIWWFYLFWLPDYLNKQFGMTHQQVMLPTFIVYGVAIVGSIYGGSIPMTLIKKGMPVYKARMTAMFIIALFPLAVLTTQYFGDVGHFGKTGAAVLAVAVICIGATAHQAWSANLFTTVSDMFPKKAVGSVTGIGTAAGGLGGVIIQKLAGYFTDHFSHQKAYFLMFLICSLSYLIAWVVMKILVPRHKPITDL